MSDNAFLEKMFKTPKVPELVTASHAFSQKFKAFPKMGRDMTPKEYLGLIQKSLKDGQVDPGLITTTPGSKDVID